MQCRVHTANHVEGCSELATRIDDAGAATERLGALTLDAKARAAALADLGVDGGAAAARVLHGAASAVGISGVVAASGGVLSGVDGTAGLALLAAAVEDERRARHEDRAEDDDERLTHGPASYDKEP